MDTQTIKTTTKDFSSLSEKMRDWLSSLQLMFLIIELNKKLAFPIEKQVIIPKLIWQLVIGEVNPKNFTEELSKQLDISPSAAKSLAQEIEEKMLRPIESLLRAEMGVDTKIIYLSPNQSFSEPQKSPIPPIKSAPVTLVTPPRLAPAPVPPPVPPRPTPPPPAMIQTAEAAHPVRNFPPVVPSGNASVGGISNGTNPQKDEVKVKINVGKSKVTWGSGN